MPLTSSHKNYALSVIVRQKNKIIVRHAIYLLYSAYLQRVRETFCTLPVTHGIDRNSYFVSCFALRQIDICACGPKRYLQNITSLSRDYCITLKA